MNYKIILCLLVLVVIASIDAKPTKNNIKNKKTYHQEKIYQYNSKLDASGKIL